MVEGGEKGLAQTKPSTSAAPPSARKCGCGCGEVVWYGCGMGVDMGKGIDMGMVVLMGGYGYGYGTDGNGVCSNNGSRFPRSRFPRFHSTTKQPKPKAGMVVR